MYLNFSLNDILQLSTFLLDLYTIYMKARLIVFQYLIMYMQPTYFNIFQRQIKFINKLII